MPVPLPHGGRHGRRRGGGDAPAVRPERKHIEHAPAVHAAECSLLIVQTSFGLLDNGVPAVYAVHGWRLHRLHLVKFPVQDGLLPEGSHQSARSMT